MYPHILAKVGLRQKFSLRRFSNFYDLIFEIFKTLEHYMININIQQYTFGTQMKHVSMLGNNEELEC